MPLRCLCTDHSNEQEKRFDVSALGVETLAEWLDDSRPIDHSGAYSMLLLGLSARRAHKPCMREFVL